MGSVSCFIYLGGAKRIFYDIERPQDTSVIIFLSVFKKHFWEYMYDAVVLFSIAVHV